MTKRLAKAIAQYRSLTLLDPPPQELIVRLTEHLTQDVSPAQADLIIDREVIDEIGRCPGCSQLYDLRTGEEIDGVRHCESCYENAVSCSSCNRRFSHLSSSGMCADCSTDIAWSCDRCSQTFVGSDNTISFNDAPVCSTCGTDGCIPHNESVWYPYSRLHRWRDGSWRSCEEPRPRAIMGYHEGTNAKIAGSGDVNTIGFELEVEPHDGDERETIATDVNAVGCCRCERDGSLSEDGFEIITDWGDLDKVLDLADKITTALDRRVNSHKTDTCGLHVHLSRDNATAYQVARMVVFWNKKGNRDFLKKFTRRWDAGYCKPKVEKGERVDEAYANGGDRYELVNVCPRRTIEVRAFRGTTNPATLKACLELAYYTWQYARLPQSQVPDEDLTFEAFMKWVPGTAKSLVAYALVKGIITEEEAKSKKEEVSTCA